MEHGVQKDIAKAGKRAAANQCKIDPSAHNPPISHDSQRTRCTSL